MPLAARRWIRRLRGGAQAHLIEADDGKGYVVKFRQNPQHRRILVNEWIGAHFLRYLQVPCPRVAVIGLDEGFLEANPEVSIQLGRERRRVLPGWHFGSCYGTCQAGDPERLAVYDFLPDALLRQIANLRDFLGVLVFDKWLANADSRQSIFFRARLKEWVRPDAPAQKVSFVALMVDHGFLFNGPHWEFPDAPLQGLYFRPLVYEQVSSLDDFQPWLSRVEEFPEEVMDHALSSLPREWLEREDEPAIERVFEHVRRRRRRIGALLEEAARSRQAVFPNWGD